MKLTTHEMERLMIFDVAEISRRRWKRGIKLNYVEATSIVCDELLERARAGINTVSELAEIGAKIIPQEDLMDGVPAMVPMIQIEVQLPDGNKLVVVHNPFRLETKKEVMSKDELLSLAY